MLDLKFVRENPDLVKEGVSNKREKVDLDKLVELDGRRREVISEAESLKHQRNVESQKIAELKKAGQNAGEQIKKMQAVAAKVKEHDEELRRIEGEMRDIQIWIPNLPHPSVRVYA